MIRAAPASRQVRVTTAGRSLVRVSRRRLATEASPSPPPATTPKKSRWRIRRVLIWTSLTTGTFYVGSTFIAYNNSRYYDLFAESVPLGQTMLEYGESHGWDTLTTGSVLATGQDCLVYLRRLLSGEKQVVEKAKGALDEKVKAAEAAASNMYKESKERVEQVAAKIVTRVEKPAEQFTAKTWTAAAIAKHKSEEFVTELDNLVRKAEAAIAAKYDDSVSMVATTSEKPATVPSVTLLQADAAESSSSKTATVYEVPLPLGFEPPPGYSRPKPAKLEVSSLSQTEPAPILLPLVVPAIAELGPSEPVVTHLASTIDNLASYLRENPAAAEKAKGVLDTARTDLIELSTRIEAVREEEQKQLEQKLDEQAREYSLKLLELEMQAQDKLDSQEDTFRLFFEEERQKFVQAYREKLDHELQTQSELINQRLKEEVIAQGIEMQRRWIREIKLRVEQERGGRLAKLDELSADLKRLERIALDNSDYLDENIRVHTLWSSLRALEHAVDQPSRTPFRNELRTLRHVAAVREDPVIAVALDSLEATDIPDIGIEPLADLTTWFTTSVAPRVSSAALVPDHNAGILSHLASHLLSSFRFQHHGLAQGDDVLSVLARAEYYLNEKNLDRAARELNQLKGIAKMLLHDWLEAARQRLAVEQALQIIESQATVASLLVV